MEIIFRWNQWSRYYYDVITLWTDAGGLAVEQSRAKSMLELKSYFRLHWLAISKSTGVLKDFRSPFFHIHFLVQKNPIL